MNDFVLTVQYEGSDAMKTLNEIVINLRNELKKLNSETYSLDIDKFKFVLRVGGEIADFSEKNGCHYLRLMKKKKYITTDIIMHQDVWKKDLNTPKKFLKKNISDAIDKMILKIKKEKMSIEEEALKKDISDILKKL